MKWRLTPSHRIEIYDNDSGKWYDYCEGIQVSVENTELLSGTKTLEVSLYDSFTGKATLKLDRQDVNHKIVDKLLPYGLTLYDGEEENINIAQVIFDSAQSAQHQYTHSSLGFVKIGNELAYLADVPIGLSDPLKSQSHYVDSEKTTPVGSLEGWVRIIKAEILGKPYMELALAIGALAPVAHLLRENKVLTLVPIIAFIGASSTGKTTCMKLIGSIYGSPEESKGLLSDLNATQNAFFAQLGNVNGLPALLDECSAVPEWDFTKVVYNLPKGRDKLRCDSEGKVRKSIHFSGAIVLSGEHSLFAQTNNSRGLFARLVELSLPWTKDGAHADRIDYGIRHNYGWAVYPLLTWLLENRACLEERYRVNFELLKVKLDNISGVEERLFKIYAAILVSAEALNHSLSLNLNIDAMSDILIAQHKERAKLLLTPEVVYQYILNKVLNNFDKFPTKDMAPIAKNLWGERSSVVGKPAIWIKESEFLSMLGEIGVDNFDARKSGFHEAGWLYRSVDRHYRIKHSLCGIKYPCFAIFYDSGADSNAKKSPKVPRRTKRIYLSSSIDDMNTEA